MAASTDSAAYCFDVIIARLKNEPEPPCPAEIPDEQHPLTVTWKNFTEWNLSKNRPPPIGNRGCLGSFDPLPLREGLKKYAIASAFEDKRFEEVTLEEVPDLHCSLSIIKSLEEIKDYRDWTVGTNGIRIHFEQNGKKMWAFYLPEVPKEKEWDQQTALDNLMHKGGWEGEIAEEDRKEVRVERYEVDRLVLSYKEYEALKKTPK
ncbi:AMMECR1 domain containing protein [Aphelenchoides avenae]|nr:AMMECR1 domain containing protein [Aphelenchus avenae]